MNLLSNQWKLIGIWLHRYESLKNSDSFSKFFTFLMNITRDSCVTKSGAHTDVIREGGATVSFQAKYRFEGFDPQ